MDEKETLGKNLKQSRQLKGLTQEVLAAKLGPTKDTIPENDLKILRKLLGQVEYVLQIKK